MDTRLTPYVSNASLMIYVRPRAPVKMEGHVYLERAPTSSIAAVLINSTKQPIVQVSILNMDLQVNSKYIELLLCKMITLDVIKFITP